MAQTPEQRRAADAERKRRSRAAAAAERDAQRAEERERERTDPDASITTTMRDSVKDAIAAMKWLKDSAAAAIAQAPKLAEMIDVLEHEKETVKALNAHGRLTRVLHDLGGTPTVRLQHELRSLRLAGKTEDDGEGGGGSNDDASEPPQAVGGNVTRFPRPKKRAR